MWKRKREESVTYSHTSDWNAALKTRTHLRARTLKMKNCILIELNVFKNEKRIGNSVKRKKEGAFSNNEMRFDVTANQYLFVCSVYTFHMLFL